MQNRRNPTQLFLIGLSLVLLIAGGFMLITGNDTYRNELGANDIFQDDHYYDNSSAGGAINISTRLMDKDYIPMRGTDPDIRLLPFNILDPDTNVEVDLYEIDVRWDLYGINIDWETLVIRIDFALVEFIGVDSDLNPISDRTRKILSEQTLDELQEWEITVRANLLALMPNTITKTDDDGIIRTYDQKTDVRHAMIYVFQIDVSFNVTDVYGNPYDSSYRFGSELRLTWDTSATWIPDETTTTTTTTTTIPDETTTKTTTTFDREIDEFDAIRSDLDMTNLKSSEIISITDLEQEALVAGSLFGMTEEQGYGMVLLISGGLLLLIGLVIFPIFFIKR